jgi:hypothetical protein
MAFLRAGLLPLALMAMRVIGFIDVGGKLSEAKEAAKPE